MLVRPSLKQIKDLFFCKRFQPQMWTNEIEVWHRDRFGRLLDYQKTHNAITLEGEQLMGQVLFTDADIQAFYLGLCNGTPTSATVLATVPSEPTTNNYSRIKIERSGTGWPTEALDTDWTWTSKLVTFYAVGGAIGPVNNMFLTRSLGSELITNGTMEADSDWSSVGTPATQERSSVQKNAGTYSRLFVPDAASEGIKGAVFTTVTGQQFILDIYVYPPTTLVTIQARKGDNAGFVSTWNVTGLTPNAWNHITRNWIETAGGAGAYIQIDSGAETSGNFYVDDVSGMRLATCIDYAALSGTKTIADSETLGCKMKIKLKPTT